LSREWSRLGAEARTSAKPRAADAGALRACAALETSPPARIVSLPRGSGDVYHPGRWTRIPVNEETTARRPEDRTTGAGAARRPFPQDRVSVAAFFALWLADVRRRCAAHLRELRADGAHPHPAGARRARLAELTPLRLESLLVSLDPLPAAQAKVRQILRQAGERAVDWELLERNPAARLKLPRAPRQDEAGEELHVRA